MASKKAAGSAVAATIMAVGLAIGTGTGALPAGTFDQNPTPGIEISTGSMADLAKNPAAGSGDFAEKSPSFLAKMLADAEKKISSLLKKNAELAAARDAAEARAADIWHKIYGETYARVDRVLDGDTIEVDGRKVRYLGLDTPETTHNTKGVQPWGPAAKKRNRELVDGRVVRLEIGLANTDRYDRFLRYVWLLDPSCDDPETAAACEKKTGSGEFVQEILLREGLARAYFPTTISRKEPLRPTLEAWENEAKTARIGVWSEDRDPFSVTKKNPAGDPWPAKTFSGS